MPRSYAIFFPFRFQLLVFDAAVGEPWRPWFYASAGGGVNGNRVILQLLFLLFLLALPSNARDNMYIYIYPLFVDAAAYATIV